MSPRIHPMRRFTARDSRGELRLPVALLVGFGPLAVGVTLLFISKTVGTVNRVMPPAGLIWVQT